MSQSAAAAQPLYLPLLEGEVIRLVDLQPGIGEDPVSLRLLIAELGHHPDYEAISYVWGDPGQTVPVLCNGRPLAITVSLNAVFKRVRYPDRSRLLWADALCINQWHDDERSHHVAFMGKVYRWAKRVLVHFGDDLNGDAVNVSSLVKEYATLISRYKSVHDMPILLAEDPALDDPRWKTLSRFHHLPWWTRAWVVQEVGLAREPICLYGTEEFDYRDLMRLAVWTTRCAPHLEFRHDVSFATVHTDWLDWSPNWQETSPDPSQTFLGLMNHSRWLSCRLKKDHIYALLGHPLAHVESSEELIVQPAYNKTDEDVYLELGKTLIRDHGLRVLSPVDHTEETCKSPLVPSWLPFYHNVELTACNFGVFPDFWYKASGESEREVVIGADDLHVRGLLVDIVRHSTQFTERDLEDLGRLSKESPAVDHQDGLLDHIMAEALAEASGQAYDADDKITALSLTLCAGLSRYRCAEDDLDQHCKDFAAYYKVRKGLQNEADCPPWMLRDQATGDYEKYLTDMKLVCEGRSFILTEKGRFGLGPLIASPGDICCILFGATIPFILRRTESEGYFKLVGEAYLQGLMRGEALGQSPASSCEEQTFIIC
ncbi:uncharacterized protein PV07_06337 [Cladophialophora immunda]|uniref:Heterokaryon incompatibility domain-containing protein n=1 Tax=Cladophialophora immunda TaxID=569365 RepID=A0A0D2D4J5_9EURO|nr:uncharacterized protein PV07_06337 [Cladophialophora immunda]KIW30604.1 hypothetical protein PV07_06337 [Cladophialophora immunda]OQU99569.1 hypothetical protein CLAIMM_05179 [Cladophialophora immunda]